MKGKISNRSIAICGLIAAVYTVICLTTPLLSYGMVQVRLAEALTLLPVLSPISVWGVTLGCAVSNLIGWFSGANPLGAMDTLFGTAATLIAGILTYKLRHIRFKGLPVLSALAPVVCNMVIVGAELTLAFTGGLNPSVYLLNALYVGIGQLIACVAVGLPLIRILERRRIIPE